MYSKKITYAITVCNERLELERLIDFLKNRINNSDEILVQYDADSVSEEVLQYLNNLGNNVRIIDYPLNKDFASFKNNIAKFANGEYIFQIDADELPNEIFVENLYDILEYNSDIDVFYIPRINTVDGITLYYINYWRWKVSHIDSLIQTAIIDISSEFFELIYHYNLVIDKSKTDECVNSDEYLIKYFIPVINFPDIQGRIYRNLPNIIWDGEVHEQLIGHSTVTILPFSEEYCLYHHKDIRKQIQQNNLYSEISDK